MGETVPYGNKPIRRPEDHDWTGRLCTFMAEMGEQGPEVDAAGLVRPGGTKLSGIVQGQSYRGPDPGGIPDFTIEVRGGSGAVVEIGLLANNFQVVD